MHKANIEKIIEPVLKLASSAEEFASAAIIIEEYGESLGFDLSFQDFDNELNALQKHYSEPVGALIMALDEANLIGCVTITKWQGDIAELRRLYVRRAYRDKGLGKKLLILALAEAKKLGYQKIRLDTLPNMKAAQKLYLMQGFYLIDPYCFHPIHGTLYMEKIL